jgi:hypothetical protein
MTSIHQRLNTQTWATYICVPNILGPRRLQRAQVLSDGCGGNASTAPTKLFQRKENRQLMQRKIKEYGFNAVAIFTTVCDVNIPHQIS